jgi:hypothetical protein
MTPEEIVAVIVFGQFALIGALFAWVHCRKRDDDNE